jgi:hypothetical protein
MFCQMVKSLIVGLALQRELRGIYFRKELCTFDFMFCQMVKSLIVGFDTSGGAGGFIITCTRRSTDAKLLFFQKITVQMSARKRRLYTSKASNYL